MTTAEATTTGARLLTAGDLLRLSGEGVRGELIRGVLHETMPTGQEHGEIVINLGHELMSFIKPRGLGRVTGSDAGVWLEHDPDTVREPDLAFFPAEDFSPGERVTGYSQTIPAIAAEVRSPGDSLRAVHDKARMWLSHGVRLVWVVHPGTRTVDVHRPDRPVATLGVDAELDGHDALPGFRCPAGGLFGPPAVTPPPEAAPS